MFKLLILMWLDGCPDGLTSQVVEFSTRDLRDNAEQNIRFHLDKSKLNYKLVPL